MSAVFFLSLMNDFFPLSSYVKEGEVPASVVQCLLSLPETGSPKGKSQKKTRAKSKGQVIPDQRRNPLVLRRSLGTRKLLASSTGEALREEEMGFGKLPPLVPRPPRTGPRFRPEEVSTFVSPCPCGKAGTTRNSPYCLKCTVRRRKAKLPT